MNIGKDENFFHSAKEQLIGQRGIGAQESVNEFDTFPEDKRVLEIGFGQGDLAIALIKNGCNYCGVDVGLASSEAAVMEGFADKGTFLYLDACEGKLPFIDNFFDYAYMTEVIEHLENPYHVFYEVKRCLKPGGIFIVSFPRPEDNFGYESGCHAHMYPGFLLKHSFRYFLKQNYFKIKKYRENGSSAWYKLENIKNGNELGVHILIQGNYDEKELYKELSEDAWDEKLDPKYEEKYLSKFHLEIKHED